MKHFFLFFLSVSLLFGQEKISVLDDFEDVNDWSVFTSEGAELKFTTAEGIKGKCVRIDYNFKFGTGYCGIQKKLKVNLPDNYRFKFFIKANSPNNNFEIKFLDNTRENVWWYNNINFKFPSDWRIFKARKKNIVFAWGPIEDRSFKEFDYIEFTISSFTGGSGTIYIDELVFEEILDDTIKIKIHPEEFKILLNPDNNFIVNTKKKEQDILLEFNRPTEIGGIKITWGDINSKDLQIFESNDSLKWNPVYYVSTILKRVSVIQFKDLETKYLRLSIKSKNIIKLCEIKLFEYEFADSKNKIFFELAKSRQSKFLPQYFSDKATYWTVIGMDSDSKEALIDFNGMIEVEKNSFSILPLIELNKKILTHHDFEIKQELLNSYLPIPSVIWDSKKLRLIIEAFSFGIPDKTPKLFIKYRIINKTKHKFQGKLHLALVPFQVNPVYQFLNIQGGVSQVKSIKIDKNFIQINDGILHIESVNLKSQAFEFEQNDAISALINRNFWGKNLAKSSDNLNSALISIDFLNSSRDTFTIRLIYDYNNTISFKSKSDFNNYFETEKIKTINYWDERLNRTKFNGSKEVKRLFEIVRSNIAYILINKDKLGIQPGSRAYERSWIRDGSLTSVALLRFGFNYEVKNFIRWYGKHIYDNGKVPCVVDSRGPDPVDEHDSHGQFIYLLNTYFKFSKDTSFVKENYNIVKKIVHYIDSMTSLRKTVEYFSDSLSAFYGLMPQSISHEGYSAKPMHSYWDDFFTALGLSSAAEIAHVLNNYDDYKYFKSLKDEFLINLKNSLVKTISNHQIDYIPGCVELGDFDPTSTSISFFPCNLTDLLPQENLKKTFNKYYEFVVQRIQTKTYENFTPYEVRNLNAFLFLHEKDRAFDLLNFLLEYQRPSRWNHWAEVVWRDSQKAAFIGDMPHTWVGSEFINAFRNFFAYEDEEDSSLKLLIGFDDNFFSEDGLFEIKNLITQLGNMNLYLKKITDHEYEITLNGDLNLKQHVIKIFNFKKENIRTIIINDEESTIDNPDWIIINQIPNKLRIKYSYE